MGLLKICSRCGTEKSVDDFALRASAKGALVTRAWCKECDVPQEVKRNPETARIAKMRQRYGISEERFIDMGNEQHWRCAICSIDISDKPYIDHDHETGRVRQLLCFHCNVALGHFKDDIDTLRAAIRYLENHYVESNPSRLSGDGAGNAVSHFRQGVGTEYVYSQMPGV